MGKRTVLTGENMTTGTGVVLAAIQSAAAGSAASNLRVTRFEISQSHNTTLALLRGEVATRNTSGTLTTTSATPVTTSPLGGAASGLSGNTSVIGGAGRSGVNSSADSGGTYTPIFDFAFANLNGYIWKPDPNEELWIPPSTVFVVRLLAAPSDTAGWDISVFLDEN